MANSDKTYDVIVIGAGAAGLAAAAELAEAGRTVLIIEARDRLGGRAFTVDSRRGSAMPIDLGAEFVHGRSPHIFDVCDEALIPLVSMQADQRMVRGGKVVESDDFWHEVDRVFNEMMNEEGKPDTTFSAFLSGVKVSQEAKESALRYAEGFNAADADKMSVQALIVDQKASDEIEGDEGYRMVGGYRQFINAMADRARKAGVEIALETVAERIEWTRGSVRVSTAGDSIDSGRACIVTIPISLLQSRSIQFVPALDEKFRHIDRIIMGKVVRIIFECRSLFWERRTLAGDESDLRTMSFLHFRDAEYFPTWWTQAPVRVPLLVAWASGKYALKMEAMDRQRIISLAQQELGTLFNMPPDEIASQIEQVHFHDWDNDPYSRGAYSYVGVNGLEAQHELATPVEGTLFFAGEATVTQGAIGTVHGAIATGKRAALELIAGV